MNERIRELAEQAEKYADNNFKGEPTYSEAYESKFAELIVVECTRVCVADLADPRDSVELRCARKIKQHFGVE